MLLCMGPCQQMACNYLKGHASSQDVSCRGGVPQNQVGCCLISMASGLTCVQKDNMCSCHILHCQGTSQECALSLETSLGGRICLSVLCRPQILNPFMVWAQEQAVKAAWPPLVAKWFDLLAAMAGDGPSASAIFNSMLLVTGQPNSDRLTWPAVLSMIQQVRAD